jgi:hypothetical protein
MPPNSDRQPASARARFHPALVSIVVSVDPAMQRASRIVDALRDIARADLTPLVDKPDDEFMPEDRRLCAMAKMAVIALDQGVTEERIAELEPAFLDEYGRFAEKARWVLQLLVDSLSVREAHAAGRELAFEARPDQLARMDAVFSQLSPEAQEAIDKVALEAKDGFHPS